MNNTITKPGPTPTYKITAPAPTDAKFTDGTAVMDFDSISDLLVEKPLRGRRRAEDEDDLSAMAIARKSGKTQSYEKLRKTLGLS